MRAASTPGRWREMTPGDASMTGFLNDRGSGADNGPMSDTLEQLSGVGPATAAVLREAGYADVASIADAELKDLVAVQGFGQVRAEAVRSEARQLTAPVAAAEVEESQPTEKAKKPKSAQTTKKGKKAKASTKDGVTKQIAKLEQRAKDLSKQAKQMLVKAEGSKSKKKRKRRLLEAADLKAAAKKARRKADKLRA
jgi:hypothetical protein